MTDLEKAARQALELMENHYLWPTGHVANKTINALRAALAALAQQQAEPVQAEPVAESHKQATGGDNGQSMTQAEPVALTDAAIEAAITAWFGWHMSDDSDHAPFRDRMRAAIKAAQDFKEAT